MRFLSGNVIYLEETFRPVLAMADDLQALIDDVLASEADSPDVKFFEHIGKYGVLRRVGTIRDRFGKDQNAVLFQSV